MIPVRPIAPPMDASADRMVTLQLQDGSLMQGYSFGAETPVAGELVFQTGIVGYPEAITDPSYEGQILVITYPLVGNYGVPDRHLMDEYVESLPKYFESNRIHIAGLVVSHYTEEYSHWLAHSSLGQWLKDENVPAIYGVDTRALTKHLRNSGSMLGRFCLQKPGTSFEQATSSNWDDFFDVPEWVDPNVHNLVANVSVSKPIVYSPPLDNQYIDLQKGPDGELLRILAIDVGMKYNQIRCFIRRGVELKVVPWDYDFTTEEYDGLFISNGPGDPSILDDLCLRLAKVINPELTNIKPIFGICLGHQLLARASGASTIKLKFGNRGHNIPCTSTLSGRCYITSQNHGFGVDVDSLTENWEPLFVNANDGSNEGIYNKKLPFFSVQFHPESTPGPRDTEFLFDVFINAVKDYKYSKLLKPIEFPGGKLADNLALHPRVEAKKVLVLGSGGLSIGQAGEFDYSGSQAIKALKEEGIYTILINPNIATIQTSKGLADKVYFLPVTAEFVRKVILHERPDAIYVTFGGQTALSVGIELKDEFEALGVKVLGTPIDTIITTEDRELFANAIDEINEKCAKSQAANSVEEALAAVKDIGFPVIVRAAYALGGLGSGFANNEKELVDLCNIAFASSPQVLVERSMKGWKEVEYEVVRDAFDNCITVCNMENFDPLGIHTGDSIVVAPSQTLSDEDYNMLRTTAVNVIRHLGVVGECNIQYALNPFSKEYCIIEVNARLSRSSALASKATGYPLAYTAAKLGLNIPLNEVKNSVTKSTCACFEPSLDYCVVKMPRWDLKKFNRVSTELSSSMKSVGEVMSIGRTFEEAIQKAIRSTEYSNLGFNETDLEIDIDYELNNPSDLRVFAIANAFAKLNYSVDKVWEMTKIDKWFLNKLHGLITFGQKISAFETAERLPALEFRQAKQLGFDDRQIAKFLDSNEVAIRRLRKEYGITPFVKQIDTVAAEFPAYTNYLYITYNAAAHDVTFDDHGVMVLGSGVYRIGSSVEFDWCAVTAVRTLRNNNIKTIMVNYNPETVSTDYDEADRLYFETINLERVLDIYEIESSAGVIVSMGGQTSNNIAMSLHHENVKILGTSPEMIDSAENRYKFSRMLDQIGVDQPAWKELTSLQDAEEFAELVSYPVLVRPSYVLSGAAMNTVYSKADLESYLNQAVQVSRDYPVVITKYIENAKEIEMDAVARNGELVMHVVSEHVENAGVHSGDATLIVPPQDLSPETVNRIVIATAKIGKALKITGPYNIQFIAKDDDIKVIECNVRASRSFPFISKVVGVNLIELATKAVMNIPFTSYPVEKLPDDYVAVKVPQFSFPRLAGADPVLGVEMASTGEVATFGHSKYEAYLKSLLATGFKLPKKNILLSIGSYKEKQELLPSVQKLSDMGYNLFATAGTADFISEHNIPVQYLEVLNQQDDHEKAEYSLTQHLANNKIDLYINLPSANRYRRPASYVSKGYRTRRMAVDYSVPLVTNVKCAKLLVEALARHLTLDVSERDAQTSHRTITIPGLINISTFVPNASNIVQGPEDLKETTRLALESGFTHCQIVARSAAGPIISDAQSLKAAYSAAKDSIFTNISYTISGTATNADVIGQSAKDVTALFLPYRELTNKFTVVSKLLNNWPADKQIIAEAKTSELASVILLATLQNRSIHITGVSNKADLSLIMTVKEKYSGVTCDVNVHAMFVTRSDHPEGVFLPDLEDQEFFWQHLDAIDAFSVGPLPAILASVTGNKVDVGIGIKDVLPLLLSAVEDGRLTIKDIVDRLHTNPAKIFGIPEDGSQVEVDLDYNFVHTKRWSPYTKGGLLGGIQRVLVDNRTVVLSGDIVITETKGNIITTSLGAVSKQESVPEVPALKRKFSFSDEVYPSVFDDDCSVAEEQPLEQKLMSSRPPQELVAPGAIQTLIAGNNPFKGRHILSIKQFKRSDFHALFAIAQELRAAVKREGVLDLMKGHVLTTIFYEPSTRTSASFITAMERLGGRTVNINPSVSSVKKGETLQDTIRTLACYGDAIVMRHPDEMSVHIAAKYSPVPIINGGNGAREHPTQALLDLFTIREELGTVNGIVVTFMGDLKNGRTVHSLCRLLLHYQVKVNLVSPKELEMPEALQKELKDANMLNIQNEQLTPGIISASDVLYCTRVQEERFANRGDYEKLKDVYIVDNKILSHAKEHMIVMHPLPRVNEIKEEVDYDHRAAYFREMKHGLYVRMALLAMVMGVDV